MKNELRKALALLLCLVMCLSLLPLSALAEELEAEAPPVEDVQPEEPVEEPEEEPEESEGPAEDFAEAEDAELSQAYYDEDVIVGFDPAEIPEALAFDYKLILERLREQLPQTLSVELGGTVFYRTEEDGGVLLVRTEPLSRAELAVEWVCAEDYDEELDEYHFSPVLEGYSFAEGITLPVVTVSFAPAPERVLPVIVSDVAGSDIPYVSFAAMGGAAQVEDTLPRKYDNFENRALPAVRDQGQFGTCWAHGTIGALEADLIHDGAADTDIDLSELHLAYFTTHDYDDEKGCNEGDSIALNGQDYLMFGNTVDLAYRYLTNMVGPALESQVPYTPYGDTNYGYAPSAAEGRVRDGVQLKGVYKINPNQREAVKLAIMEHGGVAAGVFMERSFYSYTYNSLYCPSAEYTDHIIMLVGWDDDFEATSFTSEAPDKGAWLVRNSWGLNDYGREGYFWISYYDAGLLCDPIYAMDAQDWQYGHCYAYCGCPGVSSFIMDDDSPASISTVYHVDAGEELRAVGVTTANADVSLDIEVQGGGKTVTASLDASFAGYYLVELPESITFAEGGDVTVTLIYYYSAGDKGMLPVEVATRILGTEADIEYTAGAAGGLKINDAWDFGDFDPTITLFTDDLAAASYTVSYDANGGTGAPADQTKTKDAALTLSSTVPTRLSSSAGKYFVTLDPNGGSVSPSSLSAERTTSYTFKNWNTQPNGGGTGYDPGASYTANASVTLYAQWNSVTTTASVNLPTPTWSGHSFVGWAASSTATTGVTGSYTPSGNVTLYAIWSPDGVAVTSENFPDDIFRGFVSERFDKDTNGYLSDTEIQNAKTLDCSGKGISNLKGIEFFTSLTHLYCSENDLTELDVSACGNLTWLECGQNGLSSLKVSGCGKLKYLDCQQNSLSELDLSGLSELEYLFCANNICPDNPATGKTSRTQSDAIGLFRDEDGLVSLDLSGCAKLKTLDCTQNSLRSLNLSGCGALEKLFCGQNNLYALDLSGCSSLRELTCDQNHLSALNLSGLSKLEYVNCAQNIIPPPVTIVDPHYAYLNETADLNGEESAMSSLILSGCVKLRHLDCSQNELTSLDLSDCGALEYLNCEQNNLFELDLSGLSELEQLFCAQNYYCPLPDDPGRRPTAQSDEIGLFRDENNLTSLNLSGCAKLRILDCSQNDLSALDLSGCSALTALIANGNSFTSLNLENCPVLLSLYLNGNRSVQDGVVTYVDPEDSEQYLCFDEGVQIQTAAQFTVSYDANGGTGAPADQIKTKDAALTLSSTVPTRLSSSAGKYFVTLDPNGGSVSPSSLSAERTTSYTFKNWNTQPNGGGTGYDPGASYTANASVTLYAQWNSVTSTAAVELPTPTREGFGFIGWGTSSTAASGVTGSYTPSANVTLYAVWLPDTYTVSYDANGGSGAPDNQTKTHGVALTLSNVRPTRADESAGSYTVTLNPNGGSVSPASLPAARTTSYSFKNWNTSKNGGGTSYNPGASYTANAPATLYAQWTDETVTAAVELPTPTNGESYFCGWAEAPDAQSGVFGSYTPTASVTLYAIWSDVPPGDPPTAITLSHGYLILKPGETEQLSAVGLDPRWTLYWTVSKYDEMPATALDDPPISVSDSGLVTALHEGTAYAVAYLKDRNGNAAVWAFCRIDVTAYESIVTSLPVNKVTVEVYQSEYTRVQLDTILLERIYGAQTEGEETVAADSGHFIKAARFSYLSNSGDEVREVFDLRVVDDCTLEIVPKFDPSDAAAVKRLKSTYKSGLILYFANGFDYTEDLTITVKKTVPRVTAKVNKLNSFLIGDTQPVTFSMPLTSARVDTSKANPDWLRFDPDTLSVTYTGANDVNKSGKLNLLVKPVGWALELPVTVSVSAAKTAPKLTLKPTTLNLMPGVNDLAATEASAAPVSIDEWPLTVVSVMEGRNYAPNALKVTVEGSRISVTEGTRAPRDGKAHTYKVTLALLRDGETSPAQVALTVKLLATSSKITLTAKASGTIDTAIPKSPVTVTLTPKNINAVTVTGVAVSAAKGKEAPVDKTDCFDVSVDGLTVTLTQKEGKQLDASLAYTATISTDVGVETTAKVSVKASDPNKVKPSVTLKATGAIDVIRPATSVTVTPTVKNCFTYNNPQAGDLRILRNGKDVTNTAQNPFVVSVENGVFVLTLKPGHDVDHTKDKFTLSLDATTDDGTRLQTAKPIAVTVKMGTAKFTQSVKALTLYETRREPGKVTISTAEAGLSEIDWDRTVKEFVSPKDKYGDTLVKLGYFGGGELTVFYGSDAYISTKSATVKIPVFLVGNNSAKPNATISISVKFMN